MTEAADHLKTAIDRNAPLALSVLAGNLSRLTRSRFLSLTEKGIWVALPAGQAETIDAMIESGKPVRVNFKSQHSNVEFHARVLERRRAYRLNADMNVEAVRLAWPDNIAVVQRRAAYRMAVASEEDVKFCIWRIAADADLSADPDPTTAMTIDVRDFSTSGVGGIWKRRRGEDPVLTSTQRLRVDVVTPGTTITLEAYIRFVAGLPEPDYRRVGVQFMLSPTSLADRTKVGVLNRIAGELQRAELKRLRVAR